MIAREKGTEWKIEVRKMSKDEMPDDGEEYYCNDETCVIYKKDELEFYPQQEQDFWKNVLQIRLQVIEKDSEWSFPIKCPKWLFNLLSRLEK